MRNVILGVAVSLCLAAPAYAQTAVAIADAPVFLQPGRVTPLRTAAVGTVFKVLGERDDWVQVEFRDPQFGPRVGWVEKRLVRIERPELKPMDLSIKETVPPPTRPEGAEPAVTSGAQPVEGRPHTREGFMFNVGLGFGSLGCEDCGDRWGGLSGGLMFGWQVNPKVTVGFGSSGFSGDIADVVGVTTGTLDGRFRFYFKNDGPAAGFHVNLGAGLGNLAIEGADTEWGFGLMFGVGWDIRVAKNVSLTPFWNGFAMANDLVDANVGQIGIGVTVH